MTVKMTTKDLATYVARTADLLETCRELGTVIYYKQMAEHISLIPTGIKWASHFRTTMPKVSTILNFVAGMENELGRDGSDLVKWVVEEATGEPGIGFHNRAELVLTRRPN